nr:MAG TPA: hypothetical protein [Caudoviricetes sp.]
MKSASRSMPTPAPRAVHHQKHSCVLRLLAQGSAFV